MQMGACGQKLMQHRHSQAVCNDVHSLARVEACCVKCCNTYKQGSGMLYELL
jgi:hypothetical protein